MAHQHYLFCKQHIGKVCSFRTHDGAVYSGRITRVTHSDVYLEPLGRGVSTDKDLTSFSATTATSSGTKGEGIEVLFFFPFIILPLLAIAAVGVGAYAFGRRRFVRGGYGRGGFGRRGYFYGGRGYY